MTRHHPAPILLVLYASAYHWLTGDTEVAFPAHTRVDRLNAAAKELGLPSLGVAWLSRGGVFRLTREGTAEKVGHQVGYRGAGGEPSMPAEVRRIAQGRRATRSTATTRPPVPTTRRRQVHTPLLAYTCDDGSSRGSSR